MMNSQFGTTGNRLATLLLFLSTFSLCVFERSDLHAQDEGSTIPPPNLPQVDIEATIDETETPSGDAPKIDTQPPLPAELDLSNLGGTDSPNDRPPLTRISLHNAADGASATCLIQFPAEGTVNIVGRQGDTIHSLMESGQLELVPGSVGAYWKHEFPNAQQPLPPTPTPAPEPGGESTPPAGAAGGAPIEIDPTLVGRGTGESVGPSETVSVPSDEGESTPPATEPADTTFDTAGVPNSTFDSSNVGDGGVVPASVIPMPPTHIELPIHDPSQAGIQLRQTVPAWRLTYLIELATHESGSESGLMTLWATFSNLTHFPVKNAIVTLTDENYDVGFTIKVTDLKPLHTGIFPVGRLFEKGDEHLERDVVGDARFTLSAISHGDGLVFQDGDSVHRWVELSPNEDSIVEAHKRIPVDIKTFVKRDGKLAVTLDSLTTFAVFSARERLALQLEPVSSKRLAVSRKSASLLQIKELNGDEAKCYDLTDWSYTANSKFDTELVVHVIVPVSRSTQTLSNISFKPTKIKELGPAVALVAIAVGKSEIGVATLQSKEAGKKLDLYSAKAKDLKKLRGREEPFLCNGMTELEFVTQLQTIRSEHEKLTKAQLGLTKSVTKYRTLRSNYAKNQRTAAEVKLLNKIVGKLTRAEKESLQNQVKLADLQRNIDSLISNAHFCEDEQESGETPEDESISSLQTLTRALAKPLGFAASTSPETVLINVLQPKSIKRPSVSLVSVFVGFNQTDQWHSLVMIGRDYLHGR